MKESALAKALGSYLPSDSLAAEELHITRLSDPRLASFCANFDQVTRSIGKSNTSDLTTAQLAAANAKCSRLEQAIIAKYSISYLGKSLFQLAQFHKQGDPPVAPEIAWSHTPTAEGRYRYSIRYISPARFGIADISPYWCRHLPCLR